MALHLEPILFKFLEITRGVCICGARSSPSRDRDAILGKELGAIFFRRFFYCLANDPSYKFMPKNIQC